MPTESSGMSTPSATIKIRPHSDNSLCWVKLHSTVYVGNYLLCSSAFLPFLDSVVASIAAQGRLGRRGVRLANTR